MIGWITDHVPWWVPLVLLSGGGAALFAFVPGALAVVTSIWSLLPPKARWALGAVAALAAAVWWGRYTGAKGERDKTRELTQQANKRATEVKHEFENKSDRQVDDYLEKHDDFRKD